MMMILLLLLDDHAALTRLLCVCVQIYDGFNIATDANANLIDCGFYIHIGSSCIRSLALTATLVTLAIALTLTRSALLIIECVSCRTETGTGNDGVVDDEIGRVRWMRRFHWRMRINWTILCGSLISLYVYLLLSLSLTLLLSLSNVRGLLCCCCYAPRCNLVSVVCFLFFLSLVLFACCFLFVFMSLLLLLVLFFFLISNSLLIGFD